ncbi:MAG: CHASE2 domain-containing protein, partial [Candidatus Obscuribacterales bacterium]|nr:CHASE2 domain-containing protein [Candidatus Obscuribacterales bacterium]
MKRLNEIFEAARMEGRHSLLFTRLFFGVLVGALISLLSSDWPILETMELGMLNWRYKIANVLAAQSFFPHPNNEAASKVIIVAFDNNSQFEFGCARFNDTLAQSHLAELINKIEEAQPATVVIDLDLRGAANQALIDVMSYHRNVVLSL